MNKTKFLQLFGTDHLFSAYDYQKVMPPIGNITNIKELTKLNEQGYCIFFAVNSMKNKKRSNKNAKYIRSIWVDDDDKYCGKKPKKKNIRKEPRTDFPIKPSIVVSTSPGKYQYYWLTKTKDFQEFELVMQTMIDEHGNDKGVRDLARVLRVPEFLHQKDRDHPYKVKVVGGNNKTYDWKVITTAFPPAEHVKSSTKVEGKYNKKKAKKAIKKSDDFHGSLRDRAMELANKRLDGEEIMAILFQDMQSVPEKDRDKRWHDRISDEHLAECAYSAVSKYEGEGDGATDKEESEIEKLESKEQKKATSHTEFTKTLSEDIIAPPDTAIGELTRALLNTWWTPNIMIAGLAARALVAYLGGGKYRNGTTGRMNIQQIAVGDTCTGKDLLTNSAQTMIEKIFCGEDIKEKLSRGIIDEVGSSEGFDLKLRVNGNKHDVLWLQDEIGGLMQASNRDQNKRNLMNYLLKMYTKSNQVVNERALMKSLPDEAAKTLYAPHAILSGATTPKLLVENIGLNMVTHGQFNRCMLFPVTSYSAVNNLRDIEEFKINDDVKSKLKKIPIQKDKGLKTYPRKRISSPVECIMDEDSKDLCYEIANKNKNKKKGLVRDIWSRQVANAKMYAQIEAVAENPKKPRITIEIMKRNLEFTAYACEYSVWLFDNEVAENDYELAKKKVIHYMVNQRKKRKLIVTSRQLRNHPAMRNIKPYEKKLLVEELISDRIIESIKKENPRGPDSYSYQLLK